MQGWWSILCVHRDSVLVCVCVCVCVFMCVRVSLRTKGNDNKVGWKG